MRTEASQGQGTKATSVPASPLPEEVTSAQSTGDSAETAALLDGASADSTAAAAAISATTGSATTTRPIPLPRRRAAWLVNLMQSLSLDESLGRVILSVVLAALLWFYVTSLENPAQVTQFNNITLEVRGLDPSLKVINTLSPVNVSVQAPQNIMSNLREADVRPYVDLQHLDAGVHEVPIEEDVTGLADRTSMNFSVTPRTVQVQLEVQVTRIYSLSVQVTGTPPFGFGIDPARVEPGQVKITGSESAINRIAQVVVTVDVNNSTATQSGYKSPVAIDSTGQDISGITFDPSTVQVIVPVRRLLAYKQVLIHVPVIGNPAAGYIASAIDLDPTTVTVCCAPTEVLSTVTSLDTQPISISGTTANVITTTELILPAGVQLYPGQSTEISVTVHIDTFQTTWQLSVAPSVLNLTPDTQALLTPISIDLTLAGTLAQFQSLKPGDVQASVDAAGLGPGTYQLDPKITLPQGINLVSVNPAKLSLSLIAPTPVRPTPTTIPTPEPSATVNTIIPPSPTAPPPPTPQPTLQPTLPPTATHTLIPTPSITPTETPTTAPTAPTATPTATPGNSAAEIATPRIALSPTSVSIDQNATPTP